MTPERWDQVQTLFLQAVEHPATARREFLNDVCKGDDDLRRELESLLACDDPAKNLVTIPLPSTADLTQSGSGLEQVADSTGRRIGPYRLQRLIGHGGMGSVYLAIRDDDQYEKNVAIKLLKRGMDTEFMLARFRQERQILANLEHPFIARLLDGGATDDGLPYFVMEYVDGRAITDYCTSKRLSITDRLRLFRLVCEAVQHAHQNLVVHRDLKPPNVLITKEGVPKLLDFGIAKLVNPDPSPESPTITRRELRMMTPDYASPEQALGLPISTSSDIYSLGVVLYEILTGQRPHRFAFQAPADLERSICDTEPEKPSAAVRHLAADPQQVSKQLSRQLSGDIDNIVLTAMRREPLRRYASAAEFSEDIRRHLEGLPVMAREDKLAYRAGKFLRRHKVGVAAALLVVASLVGGIVTTTFQARRSERRFQLARQLANTVLFDLHDQIERLPGSTSTRASMIRTVVRYLDSLARDSGRDPELEMEIARSYHRVATVQGHPFHQNLGQTADARTHYRKAIELYEGLPRTARMRPQTIEWMIAANIEAGDIEAITGNAEAAREFFRKAEAIANEAAARNRKDVSLDSQIYVYFRLGDTEAQRGAAEDALPHYQKALEIAREWAAVDKSAGAVRTYRGAYQRLASTLQQSGDLKGAGVNLGHAHKLAEQALREWPRGSEERQNVMGVHQALGDLLGGPDHLNLGDRHAALAQYRAAVEIMEGLVSSDRGDVRALNNLSSSYSRLGSLLIGDKPAEAHDFYRKALRICAELLASNPAHIEFRRDNVMAHLGTGEALRRLNRSHDALAHLSRALELQNSVEAAAPHRVWLIRPISRIYTETGNALLDNGDEAGALARYREALAAAETVLQRVPSALYLVRDRADVFEAFGAYYLTLATRPGVSDPRLDELNREARSWFGKSLNVWQSWRKRNVAPQYAAAREAQVSAAIARCEKRE